MKTDHACQCCDGGGGGWRACSCFSRHFTAAYAVSLGGGGGGGTEMRARCCCILMIHTGKMTRYVNAGKSKGDAMFSRNVAYRSDPKRHLTGSIDVTEPPTTWAGSDMRSLKTFVPRALNMPSTMSIWKNDITILKSTGT